MGFDLERVDPLVIKLLSVRETHPLPLAHSIERPLPDCELVQGKSAAVLFPRAVHREEAYSGLLLILRCWEESHRISQELDSVEGSYWHALAHRIEPDLSNSNYWFRRVGRHPIFPALLAQAGSILGASTIRQWKLKDAWDPAEFNRWCEEARRTADSQLVTIATRIQQAEWDLLFQWCLSAGSR